MSGLRRQTILPEGDEEILVVTDLATLRVVSDPQRLRLLELLRDRPRTVKELAEALGAPPTRLYYHVNLLLEHGLIRVASTRTVSGIVEKTYAATASRLSIDRSVLLPEGGQPDEGLETLLAVILDEAKAEIRRGVQAGAIDPANKRLFEGGLYLGRIWARLSRERLREFMEQFEALALAFETEPGEGPTQTYEALVGLYPTTPSGQASGDQRDG